MKYLLAGAFAVALCAPEAVGQSLLHRTDRQDHKLETYLPRAGTAIPWLERDTKTRWPKGDVIPLGRDVASVSPFVLPHGSPHVQTSANVVSPFRSM